MAVSPMPGFVGEEDNADDEAGAMVLDQYSRIVTIWSSTYRV